MTEPVRPRSRLRVTRLTLAGGLAAAVALGPSAPGHAGPTVEAGWWMAPIGVAPDAPDDGLVVQGGPAGELAYSAVRFTLTPGNVPETLLLRVAPDSASTPDTTLSLCALTEPFTPTPGGPMADAPEYDCERSVEEGPSADGTTYTFAVAALVDGDALAVAILPTAATDRVVLSAPGSYSLMVADSSVPPAPLDPSFPSEAPPAGTLDLPPSSPVERVPTFPPVASPTPDVAASPAVEPPLVTAPAAQERDPDVGSWLPPVLFVGLAAAALALWGAAGAADALPQ